MSSIVEGSHRDNRKHLHVSVPGPSELALDQSQEGRPHPIHPPRSGSMATVKLKRRTKLAEKLKEIFELDDIQEVVAGTSYTFLGRGILLINVWQRCPVGFCGRFVSLDAIPQPVHILISDSSITGIHVSHRFVSLLLRSHALPRGKSHPNKYWIYLIRHRTKY